MKWFWGVGILVCVGGCGLMFDLLFFDFDGGVGGMDVCVLCDGGGCDVRVVEDVVMDVVLFDVVSDVSCDVDVVILDVDVLLVDGGPMFDCVEMCFDLYVCDFGFGCCFGDVVCFEWLVGCFDCFVLVCGCDCNIYLNVCEVWVVGISVVFEGECLDFLCDGECVIMLLL